MRRIRIPGLSRRRMVSEDALKLLGSLVLEDERLWGDVAKPWQWDFAEWFLDIHPDTEQYRWESRPRGGSKTTDVAGLLIVAMLEVLPPGSESFAMAVDRDQAARIVRYADGLARRTPSIASAIKRSSFRLTAPNGSYFEALSSDAASSWGSKPARVVLDEFCQWPNTKEARENWSSADSSMGKVAGSKLVIATTSGDPGHWSHDAYQTARKSKKIWTIQEVPGPLPWTPEKFLEAQRLNRPESEYARLHLNKWAAPEDRLTTVGQLEKCVAFSEKDGTWPIPPAPGTRYVIGCDFSTVRDASACAVMHVEWSRNDDQRRQIDRIVLDQLKVWKPTRDNPIDFDELEEWVVSTSRAYRGARAFCDQYQSAAVAQRVQSRGVSLEIVNLTMPLNDRIGVTMMNVIRSQRLAIPDDKELLAELSNIQLIEKAPGMFKMEQRSGEGHHDRASAIGLAVLKLTEIGEFYGARPIIYSKKQLAELKIAEARTLGDTLPGAFGPVSVAPPAPLGQLYSGYTAMPDSVIRVEPEDLEPEEDEPEPTPPNLGPGRFTKPSPFV